MCGRYYIASEDSHEEIERLINEINRREAGKIIKSLPKTGEVFPSDNALVVANSRALSVRPFVMRWGFAMKNTAMLINARSESMLEKNLFRPLVSERRLIVPASGYYEWEKANGQRVKYEISTGKQLIYMAGLYRQREDGCGHEFVILTRGAAPEISFIHARMPVVLSSEAALAWLSRDTNPETVLKRSEEVFSFRQTGAVQMRIT